MSEEPLTALNCVRLSVCEIKTDRLLRILKGHR